ncbi:MAG: LutB/LldF family L-lactate oxidation iron-sulfur protein [Ardenticatenaceae bacterium]
MHAPNVTFNERIEEAVAHPESHQAVGIGARRFAVKRVNALASFPQADEYRDRARLIRAHTLSQLDTYLAQFADRVEALGGHVFWAKNAQEANHYVVELARAKNVKQAIKSKSMVTEEIELNHALEGIGVEVAESDLGEFIIQLASEKPSHIIAPVMHKTRQQVGQLFHEKLGVPYTDDPIELNKIARAHLRRIFLSADLGISGVNFGVAESGTICIVTNEGNARLSTTAPRIHVAMMGMERLVPTFEDLGVMLQILARSATGQKLSVYSTLITGPRRSKEDDGPEEFHVVILDNGRSKALAGEMAEILYCIRCGACLNACPVYQSIGGHAYGSVYPGPVGAIVTPSLMGMDPWSDLAHASTLCGACKEVCPVRIDIPRMLLKLREEGHKAGQSPTWLKTGLKMYSSAAQRPTLYSLGMRASSVATRVLGKNDWMQKLPGPLSGWTDHRAFPKPAPKPFRQLWKERQAKK